MDYVSTESATTVFNGVPPMEGLGVGDDNLALKTTSQNNHVQLGPTRKSLQITKNRSQTFDDANFGHKWTT